MCTRVAYYCANLEDSVLDEQFAMTDKGRLEHILGESRVSEEIVLAPLTTFRIGGPADLFFEASSAEELVGAISAARDLSIPFFLLGRGANILIGDRGIRGLVVHNKATRFEIHADSDQLFAESGAIMWPDIIKRVVDAGLSGLEHYAGIPSTVGGALWQNLHFLSPPPERERTMFLEEVVLSAEILTPAGERKSVPNEYFDFGYDQSILHTSGDIVLSATFQLNKGDPLLMRSIVDANLEWRRERHPPLDTEPSIGSIFKKIEGIGAGRIIDECGLKGTKIGGIEITHRHANIMINRGAGTARDVMDLIQLTRETVQRETGYDLQPEVAFVGEF
ncbi:MAG: UDP-N-acetylmuramate dehydrogenase [Rhodothermia bacterium]|nr:MAG: UDP-N-acetylmuramate dehydrogenase [Rhodothermia bacterium]